MNALLRAARLACLALLAVSAYAQGPGPHAIVRIHSLDPDQPGDAPVDLVIGQGGVEFAVLHRDSADLSFHRTSDGEFLARIELGGLPTRAAATPDGTKIIVVDQTAHEVVVVDAAARSIEARIPVPTAHPIDVLVTPDGRQALIIPFASMAGRVVTLVDLVSNAVAGSIQVPSGGSSGSYSNDGAVLSGDGSQLLLLGSSPCAVDLTSGLVRWTPPTDFRPAAAGWLNSAGDRGLVVADGPGFGKHQWSIDVAQGTQTLVGDISNSESTTRLIVTHDGQHAAFGSAAGLLFADLSLGTTTRVSGVNGSAIASTRNGEAILAIGSEGHMVFDIRTAAEITRFPGGWVSPTFSSDLGGDLALVLDEDSERAAVLDLDPVAPSTRWTHSTGQGIEVDGVPGAQLAAGGELVAVIAPGSWNIVFQDPATGRSAGSLEFQQRFRNAAIGGDVALVGFGFFGSPSIGALEVWKIDGTSPVGVIPVDRQNFALAVTQDGDFAIAAARTSAGPYELLVIDTADPLGGAGYRVTLPAEVFPYASILSPGGRWIAMSSSGSEWYLFDLELRQVAMSFVPSDIGAIAFSEDDQTLFMGSDLPDHAVTEFDLSGAFPVEVGRHLMPPGTSDPIGVEVDRKSGRVWAMGLGGLGFFDPSAPSAFTWLDASTADSALRVLGPHAIVTRAGRYQRFFVREAGPSIELVENVTDPAIAAPSFTKGPRLDTQRGWLTTANSTSNELCVIDLGSTRPVAHCSGAPGQSLLTATGPFVAHGTTFELAAAGLPPGAFGFPLMGTGDGQLPLGNGICIGPQLRRLPAGLAAADASGVLRIPIVPNDLSVASGTGVEHGEAWRFQVWHRGGGAPGQGAPGQGAPGQGALTNALEVYFR